MVLHGPILPPHGPIQPHMDPIQPYTAPYSPHTALYSPIQPYTVPARPPPDPAVSPQTFEQRRYQQYTCYTVFFISIEMCQIADVLIRKTRRLSLLQQGLFRCLRGGYGDPPGTHGCYRGPRFTPTPRVPAGTTSW